MNMTPKQWKTILNGARKQQMIDEKIGKKLSELFDVLSPTNNTPFIELTGLEVYLTAIEDIYGKEIQDNVSYWIYEIYDIRSRGEPVIFTSHGKKYDVRKMSEYIKCLVESDS